MQLFKYIFVAFYAWQCTIANALLVPNLDPLVTVPAPNTSVTVPDIPHNSVPVPGIPNIEEQLPSVPDIGEVIPGVPDLGELIPDVPGLPDLGELIPDVPGLPDIGELIPDLGELLPDLGLGSTCRRGIVGRGIGTFVTPLCKSDEEEVLGICFPKCQNGYENIGGSICRKTGCGVLDGATDMGMSCEKPPAYGRGAGYFNLSKCVLQNTLCEKSGLLFYPTCSPGFTPVGCCICSPNCPLDYINDGAFCRKPSYDRGFGVIRLGCELDKEYSAGFCYTPCSNNGIGVGPLCWGACGGLNSFECGIFCTPTPVECAAITLELTTSVAKIAADIAGLDAWNALLGIYVAGRRVAEPNTC